MNLYKISQEVNTGYETYDACIVAAESEEQARLIHPGGREDWDIHSHWHKRWADIPDQVTVELIGTAKPGTEPGVMLASFNAG